MSSTVRTPSQDRSMETKRRIREAGEALFSQKGYHHTNSKEIAKEAGVSTGSFYAYYSDKAELFCAIVEEYYLQIFDEIKHFGSEAFEVQGSLQSLTSSLLFALYRAHSIETGLHREITVILLESRSPSSSSGPDARLYQQVSSYVKRLDEEVLQWVETLMARLYPNLERDRRTRMARLVFTVCEQLIHELKLSEEGSDHTALLEELAVMLSSYLEKAGGQQT